MQRWIDKIANRMRRLAIPSLMKYIVICMGAVFILDFIFNGMLSGLLAFSKAAILHGQV